MNNVWTIALHGKVYDLNYIRNHRRRMSHNRDNHFLSYFVNFRISLQSRLILKNYHVHDEKTERRNLSLHHHQPQWRPFLMNYLIRLRTLARILLEISFKFITDENGIVPGGLASCWNWNWKKGTNTIEWFFSELCFWSLLILFRKYFYELVAVVTVIAKILVQSTKSLSNWCASESFSFFYSVLRAVYFRLGQRHEFSFQNNIKVFTNK